MRLAKVHFALYNIGLPIMLVALSVFVSGTKAAGPVIDLGATLLIVGIICFVINLFRQARSDGAVSACPAQALVWRVACCARYWQATGKCSAVAQDPGARLSSTARCYVS
jgi:hypothetical protein